MTPAMADVTQGVAAWGGAAMAMVGTMVVGPWAEEAMMADTPAETAAVAAVRAEGATD